MSKPLLETLRAAGLLEYGSAITGDQVRTILGVELPVIGTKKQFDEAALLELSAIGYVRDQLLAEGKYLAGCNGDYRVLLPSENARQAELYIASANRKYRRAQKLRQNTPVTADCASPDVRLAMRAQSRLRA